MESEHSFKFVKTSFIALNDTVQDKFYVSRRYEIWCHLVIF